MVIRRRDERNTPAALSVVAPCFNEEGVLPEFLRRVWLVLDGLMSEGEGRRRSSWSTTARAMRPGN
jgi:hypothetical protein